MQIVSSHVRRAAVVPLINWSSTARRIPRFGLHRISFVRSSEKSSRILVLGNLGVKMEGHPPWARRCAPPRPALACGASLCPASPLRWPGFGFDKSNTRCRAVDASLYTASIPHRPASSCPARPRPAPSCPLRHAAPRPAISNRFAPPGLCLPRLAPPRLTRPNPLRLASPGLASFVGCPGFEFDKSF